MQSLAVPVVGVARQLQLVGIEGNDVDPAAVQEQVELAARRCPFARLDDNAGLLDRNRRHQARRVGLDVEGEELILLLA